MTLNLLRKKRLGPKGFSWKANFLSLHTMMYNSCTTALKFLKTRGTLKTLKNYTDSKPFILLVSAQR